MFLFKVFGETRQVDVVCSARLLSHSLLELMSLACRVVVFVELTPAYQEVGEEVQSNSFRSPSFCLFQFRARISSFSPFRHD